MKKNHSHGRSLSRRALLLGTTAGATFLLTGCPALFVGGVAVGAATALDRRTAGAQADDQIINLRSTQELGKEINDVHINVNSYNRRVLLTGEVRSAEQKAQAEAIVKRVQNVAEVINALAIGPNTGMGSRSSDTYITGKVKAAITAVEGVSAADVKVITERSVVYLMGILTAREAAQVSKGVATVSGVRKVVQVFEIVTEAELQKILDHVQDVHVPEPDDDTLSRG